MKSKTKKTIATVVTVIKTVAQFCKPWTLVAKIGAVLSVLTNKDKIK